MATRGTIHASIPAIVTGRGTKAPARTTTSAAVSQTRAWGWRIPFTIWTARRMAMTANAATGASHRVRSVSKPSLSSNTTDCHTISPGAVSSSRSDSYQREIEIVGTAPEPTSPGPFEARYLAFLETITYVRPSLHRYCARMTRSVTGGPDLVPGAVFQTYRELGPCVDERPLAPWLFRMRKNASRSWARAGSARERKSTRRDRRSSRSCAPALGGGRQASRAVV